MSDLVQRTRSFSREAVETFLLAVRTARWVSTHMFSHEGIRYMRYALAVYLLANLLEQLAPYFVGQLVTLHTEGTTDGQLILVALIGATWGAGVLLERFGNNLREWGWNENTRSARYNLTEEHLRRTPGEHMAEDRDIGANQIESCADKMHHIQRAVYFELSNVIATLVVCLGLVSLTDPQTGLWLLLIVIGNAVVLFFMNHYIHQKASRIDARMRQFHNRLVEYWHGAILIIASGIRQKILSWVCNESYNVLWDDYLLWGIWFQIVDGIRSLLTNLLLATIIYHGYFRWETGEFVAIFSWILIYRQKFWSIGEVQRTLAEHAERLHALREAFEKEPAFDHEMGLPYEKGG